MPIKDKSKYPANWKDISLQVRFEAGNQCELCDCRNGEPNPKTGSKVVLTVHHLDFNPSNNKRYNLIALCQRCHLRLDAKWKAYKKKIMLESEG
jgi:5-methylcytosine-specific restriction endonuclease McrA